MQKYWIRSKELRSTYAFHQLFSRVSSQVLKLVNWKNCSINHWQTFFIGNSSETTYLMCPGRFCIFLTALWRNWSNWNWVNCITADGKRKSFKKIWLKIKRDNHSQHLKPILIIIIYIIIIYHFGNLLTWCQCGKQVLVGFSIIWKLYLNWSLFGPFMIF